MSQRRIRKAPLVVIGTVMAFVVLGATASLGGVDGDASGLAGQGPSGPTPTPTPPPPDPGARSITLEVSDGRVVVGDSVTFSGQLTAVNPVCQNNARLEIRRQVHGTTEFVPAGPGETDEVGAFSRDIRVQSNADYIAVASARDEPGIENDCPEATSAPVTVLAKVRVTARSRTSPAKGDKTKVEFEGKVDPAHAGTPVKLERKGDNGWYGVDKQSLKDDSSFKFKFKAKWTGKRVYRVVWPKGDPDHEEGKSDKMKIVIRNRDDRRGPRVRG